jgi:hypothetical protein
VFVCSRWKISFYFMVYKRIVSVINLRVSIYSVVLQYFIYSVIIMITYLLMCVLVAPIWCITQWLSLNFCSHSSLFEIRSGHRFTWLRLPWFYLVLPEKWRRNIWLDHDHLLPDIFQVFMCYPTLYILRTKSFIIRPTKRVTPWGTVCEGIRVSRCSQIQGLIVTKAIKVQG